MRFSPRTNAERQARALEPRGFTLIEMVVVVVVMAILGAIAVPRFTSAASHHRADAAAVRIMRDLTLARAHARATSASLTVTFDVATSSYELVGMAHPNRSSEDYVVPLAKEPYRATIVSADFDGDAEVIFDGYGTPDSGGTVIIRNGNWVRTIELDANTGETRILDL